MGGRQAHQLEPEALDRSNMAKKESSCAGFVMKQLASSRYACRDGNSLQLPGCAGACSRTASRAPASAPAAEAAALRLKSRMARVGDVRTFDNFVVPVPQSIDVSGYNTAIVWCESFSMFITAAKYR
jgi:hypothetical protein